MNDIAFTPMLASNVVWPKVRYPVDVSPKIDGFRCVMFDGVAYSRSGKPIRNQYLQRFVGRSGDLLNGLDGELIVGADPTAPDLLRRSSSAFNSIDKAPEFTYYVFDSVLHPNAPWRARFEELSMRMLPPWAQFVSHLTCENERQVLAREEECVAEGYEGLMLRDPFGRYKNGRSTANEALLLKVKRFNDAEAVVIGFEEQMHNGNEALVNAQGRTYRQSLQENKTGAGVLGSLRCRLPDGTEFNIGTGFDAVTRRVLWQDRDSLIDKLVTYKSMPYGEHEAPRFPVFKAFRSKEDM